MNQNLTIIGVVAGLAFASSCFGQAGTGGSISSGNVNFTIADYMGDGTGAGPSSNLTVGGAGNPDHLQAAWWWFRLAGDNRETAFSNATSANYSGAQGRVNYSYASFDATMIWRVTGFGNGRGLLTQTMTIRNTSSEAIVIQLFNFNDLAVGGTDSNDVATQIASNTIRVDDGGNTGWKIAYEGTDSFDVTSGAVNVLNLLTDNVADVLGNRGLPVGGGSFEGAYQWSITLNPNEAATASSTLTITPTPGTLALLGLGGLAAARRRR